MKNKTHLLLFISILSTICYAQSKKQKDITTIKKMCGCYEVSFDFAETFSYTKDSTYQPSKVKHDKALEWVELVKDTEDELILQHLLIVNDTMIIKHWRQDWLYEHTDLYMYDKDNHWDYIHYDKKDVAGQWTQKVFQVDDSPRYEGTATWVYIDGKSFWENRTDAPLPRREYTKRNDYNVTVRGNRHEIVKEGWLHAQLNDKVIRTSKASDLILAQEVGLNTYKKVPDNNCIAAQKWWKENQLFWKHVRDIWGTVFDKKQGVTLKHKVEDKRLYEYLFHTNHNTEKKEIERIINSFVTY